MALNRDDAAPDEGSVSSPQTTKRFPRRARDRALANAMRGNHGLITRGELFRMGFSSAEVHGFVTRGELRRLHRGVYADGRAPLSDHALLKASLLAFAGRNAWLSGTAAAMGWNFEPVSIPNLEVTIVASATPRQRASLTVRSVRTLPHASEIRKRRNLRLSSVPRMLLETAAQGATPEDLHRLIEQAVRRNLLDIPDLAATLTRNLGHPGIVSVKATCQEYLPHTDRKSGLERAFDRWLTKHPEIPPPPQRNIRLGPWEIDCYWPAYSLALELDGRPYHTVIDEIERDNRKNTWLQANGKRILRVTDSRFKRDKPGVYRDLKAMLAVGSGGQELAAAA